MGAFRFDRLLDLLISTEFLIGLLWAGLAALTVVLLVLMRTRWGQSRPLRKCLVLSLLAHLLLAGYATTVQIVASTPQLSDKQMVRVSITEEDPKEAPTITKAQLQQKPWESFVHDVSSPPDPSDPEPIEPQQPDQAPRQPRTEENGLPGEASLKHVPLAEAVKPEPEGLPSEATQSKPAEGKSAEPIQAPAAQRRQSVRTVVPVRAAPERRSPKTEPPRTPKRTSRSGVPSALLEQPVPVPRMKDAPRSLDPETSLADLTDWTSRPARGSPAASAGYDLPRPGGETGMPDGADGTSPGTRTGKLWTPSIASLGGEHRPGGDDNDILHGATTRVGPPLISLSQPAGEDHQLPPVYKLRMAPDRSRVAQRHGATPETEAAVRAALKWLADNQAPDGRWDARSHGAGRASQVAGRDRGRAGIDADTGMTGLALLAFLAAGHTHQQGLYQSNVRRGLEFLLDSQGSDGNLGGRAAVYSFMYCHAMATFALSEAYGMTADRSLHKPVSRAVEYIIAAQDPSQGGWRYKPREPGDTSQLGWQLMALKSAELAGIPTPQGTRQRATRFLKSVSSGHQGGLASYRPGEKVSRAMTAEALVCRQFMGSTIDDATAREAGDYLLGEMPGDATPNLYYWYYATLGLYQLQGLHWQQWNEALRTTLLESQVTAGTLAGTWDPNTVWGGYGGRVYSTALAALCLEVYYRFLPLYIEASASSKGRE